MLPPEAGGGSDADSGVEDSESDSGSALPPPPPPPPPTRAATPRGRPLKRRLRGGSSPDPQVCWCCFTWLNGQSHDKLSPNLEAHLSACVSTCVRGRRVARAPGVL